MEITQHIWGISPEGEAIILYTMTNASGASVSLTNYGATIVSIIVPDGQGTLGDVALGYGKWQDYIADAASMGKSIGRYANRIACGRFSLEGKECRLSVNSAPNHLHGGPRGFQNQIWESRVETDRVVFAYQSTANDEGYPGELSVEACFDWDDDCNLEITYFAKTDTTTIVNLTNHLYLNLAGHGSICDHTLQLAASRFLPTDRTLIPTGELATVEGTPMDFREPHVIGEKINEADEQLINGNGYDHCWAIDGFEQGRLNHAATLIDPQSRRQVTVVTTQPGIQVYTGNWLEGSPLSRTGAEFHDRDGIALECQAFPDSPNQPQFPSTVLTPEDEYQQRTIYSFSIAQK